MYISSFQNLNDLIEIKNLIETEYKENVDSDPQKKEESKSDLKEFKYYFKWLHLTWC